MKKITISICFFIFLFIVSSSYGQYKVKGIFVYIDFSDSPAWVTPERLDGLINGLNYTELGVQRSIRAYWLQQSRGKIDMTHDIFFYRAPQTKAYYDKATFDEAIQMQKGALTWVAANHPEIDWNSYTISDNTKIANRLDDGYFQSVNFIYSEPSTGSGGTNMFDWIAPNGKHTQKSEAIGIHQWWDPTPVNISPVCHEMGHSIFGVPDTYDNDGSSNGTGIYSLMSAGAPEAEPLGGPFLAQHNFATVIKASGGTQRVKLIADGNSVFQYFNAKDPNEYFTIEARKKSTLGNALLATDIGLIIWHSDESIDTYNSIEDRTQAKHFRHSIEQADGNFDLEKPVATGNRGDAGDMYVSGKSFTSNTTPNSNWWNNENSDLSITNIQINGDEVSFDVTSPTPPVINPKIPQAGWTLKSTDSQEDDSPATNAFDGNPSTIWHTRWQNNVTSYPHEMQINLGESYSISGLELTSRDGRFRTKGYQIYVSTDGNNWGQAVSTGELKDSYAPQTVFFPAKTGQYLKFVCTSTTGSSTQLTIVNELNLYGIKSVPVAAFNVSKNNIIMGESVTFTDTSSNSPTAWTWTFEGGTPATSTQQNPVVKYNNAGSYKATLIATNAIGSNTLNKANVVVVGGSNSDPVIPQSGWTLKSADSEEAFCCVATKAFDGDTSTIWHTKWGDTDKYPHEIQINLGTSYSISAFEYTASSGANGRIKDYQIYISTDGNNWGTAVATGQFTSDLAPQTKTFGAKTGQYLKLVALSEINGNVWTSVAEINLHGKPQTALGILDVNETKDDSYKAYPNPTNGSLSIEIPNDVIGKVNVSVLNTAGMMVQSKLINTNNNRVLELDLRQLSKGLYIVRLTSNSITTKYIKVIVE